jgi:mycofactocin precursor
MSPMPTPETAPAAMSSPTEPAVEDQDLVEDELLVEEISIDGMCGVY